jgi:hypothetical protein
VAAWLQSSFPSSIAFRQLLIERQSSSVGSTPASSNASAPNLPPNPPPSNASSSSSSETSSPSSSDPETRPSSAPSCSPSLSESAPAGSSPPRIQIPSPASLSVDGSVSGAQNAHRTLPSANARRTISKFQLLSRDRKEHSLAFPARLTSGRPALAVTQLLAFAYAVSTSIAVQAVSGFLDWSWVLGSRHVLLSSLAGAKSAGCVRLNTRSSGNSCDA